MPEGTPRPFERQIHPGSGRRKAPKTPKGRQLDFEASEEVKALLGDRPRRPDLLIEHLHLIQDRYGHLAARHLRALAEEMNLPMAAVYAVASSSEEHTSELQSLMRISYAVVFLKQKNETQIE